MTAPLARSNDYATSLDAAQSIKSLLGEMRAWVLKAFERAGPNGLTDNELHEHMSCKHGRRDPSTYRKRRTELSQMGFLLRTEATRANQGIYVLAPLATLDALHSALRRMDDKERRAWMAEKIATAPKATTVDDGWVKAAAFEICRLLHSTDLQTVSAIIRKHAPS